LSYKFRVYRATIEPDFDTGCFGSVSASPNARNTLLQKITVAVIGPVAHARELGVPLNLRAAEFRGDAAAIRALLWDCNPNMHDPLRSREVRAAILEAQKLLERHETLLEIFAHSLRVKRTLYRRDITYIYQSATSPVGFTV
jgi:hypothetical protein